MKSNKHVNKTDLLFFKISIGNAEKVANFEITETFKRRVDPFPSTMTLHDD